MESAATTPLAAAHKAAVLLILMGEQAGAELVRHLSADEITLLGRVVSSVETIDSSQAEQVLDEYVRMTQARQYVLRGGPDYARRMLTGAIGEDKAARMIERLEESPAPEAKELATIETADPRSVASLLENEHSQAAAIVLSRLSPARAAAVLQMLPGPFRLEVSLRLGSLDRVPPETLSKIAEVIGKKLRTESQPAGKRSGGVRALADVLNHIDAGTAEELLNGVAESDPNTAELVRHHMFVFEDILNLGQEAMKEIVGKVDRAVLTIALKGTSEKLRAAVMQCLSQRGADMLKDDMEAAGPVRIRDVEQAQRKIVAVVRQMQQDGAIGRAGEQYVV